MSTPENVDSGYGTDPLLIDLRSLRGNGPYRGSSEPWEVIGNALEALGAEYVIAVSCQGEDAATVLSNVWDEEKAGCMEQAIRECLTGPEGGR